MRLSCDREAMEILWMEPRGPVHLIFPMQQYFVEIFCYIYSHCYLTLSDVSVNEHLAESVRVATRSVIHRGVPAFACPYCILLN